MRALRHSGADRRLRRDGFVVLPSPVLSVDDAHRLRAAFLDHHGRGSGFHADLMVPDPDYRRAMADMIDVALAPADVELFVDHQVFLRNFLCKWPGESSELYLHRDWMYVDERQGDRTYVLWVALQDITGHNGQLQVLRGSHRWDRRLRGSELNAPWIQHDRVIRERLLTVPVRAGQAVVFDNALVHGSYPNLTDAPRVVAATGLRPMGSRLVHYRRDAEGTAVRYDVDESFFLSRTPQELLGEAPDLPVSERCSAQQEDWSADELARRADRGLLARLDKRRRNRDHRSERVGDRRSVAR